jgi:hypothetical protein
MKSWSFFGLKEPSKVHINIAVGNYGDREVLDLRTIHPFQVQIHSQIDLVVSGGLPVNICGSPRAGLEPRNSNFTARIKNFRV